MNACDRWMQEKNIASPGHLEPLIRIAFAAGQAERESRRENELTKAVFLGYETSPIPEAAMPQPLPPHPHPEEFKWVEDLAAYERSKTLPPPAVVSDRPPCRVCKCTNQAPCIPPCMWIVDGVCSTCLTAANALADWMLEAHKPRTLALIAEAKILFDRAIELSRLSRKAGE